MFNRDTGLIAFATALIPCFSRFSLSPTCLLASGFNRQSTGETNNSSELSRTKSRDYNALHPRERSTRDSLFPLSFRIPPSPVVSPFLCPVFLLFRIAIFSRRRLSQHASPPFLFTTSKLLLFAYLLSYPSLRPDFVHTMWSAVLSILLGPRGARYLSLGRKRRKKEDVETDRRSCTRGGIVLFFSLTF